MGRPRSFAALVGVFGGRGVGSIGGGGGRREEVRKGNLDAFFLELSTAVLELLPEGVGEALRGPRGRS